ncbi:MAG: hypothetical protein E6J14_07965 [Chloroflexi bacterium]|nr:MAG: hypothetical protein E6J14_07965 [Chloroflexota bacterium]
MQALLGRDREMAILRGAVADAGTGRGQMVLIEGEPGVGKTRLLEEGVAEARRCGCQVFSAGAGVAEAGRPCGALLDALGVADAAGDPTLAGLADRSPGSEAGRARLINGLIAHVDRLAGRAAVAIALDDLDRADPGTLLALDRLGRRAEARRLLILAAFRASAPSPELAAFAAAAGSAGATIIELAPLDAAAVVDLVRVMVGTEPGPRLLEQVLGAGGDPLLVTELVNGLRDDGAVEVADGVAELMGRPTLPRRLRGLMRRRLRTLDRQHLAVLKAASLLGSSFPVDDLAAVLATPAVELAPALEEAARLGLIVEKGERYAFRHPVVRELVYLEQPPPLRTALHLQAGRALAARHAPAWRVATQLALGAEPGDEETVGWLRQAALEASAQAPAAARELIASASRLAGTGYRDQRALRLDEADVLVWAGRPREGELAARALLEGAAPGGPEERARLVLARALAFLGRWQEAAEQFSLIAARDETPEPRRAQLLAQAALVLALGCDLPGASRAAETAVLIGAGVRDARAVSTGLLALSITAAGRGYTAKAVELSARAVALAQAGGDETLGRTPHVWHGWLLAEAGRIDEARQALAASRRTANQGERSWHLALHDPVQAHADFLVGAWDDAVAELEAGLLVAEQVETRWSVPHILARLALIAVHRDELDGATAHLRHAERAFGTDEPREFGWEWLAMAQAALAEARGERDRALEIVQRGWLCATALEALSVQLMLGPPLIRLSGSTADRALVGRVLTAVDRTAARAMIPSARAAALRCRGLAERDPSLMQRAVDAYLSTPRRVDLAATCRDAATVLAARDRRDEAVAMAEEARSIFGRIGARRDEAEAAAMLRELGAHPGPRGRHARAAHGWESLTPAEREVVRLAAQGLTNPEIGARLFVSRRTVETHLSHVFTKLGVSSRVQLAASVARRSGQVRLERRGH